MAPLFKSSLGIKYSSLRDHPLHSDLKWLEGKRLDDGAENLWRIHNQLYDLTSFIDDHPGGSQWLKMTKGTDITEAFETHHISNLANKMLPQFHVKTAESPRNAPFTFHEDGFYKTLRRNIYKEYKKAPKAPLRRSKTIADLLLASYICLALLAVYRSSYLLGVFSGLCLSMNAIAAHNFFHQKDNFRMYYFDFTLMQSRSWRISHVLSHHLYTNTVNDMEISFMEPFLQYLPVERNVLLRYSQWVISPFVYCFTFIAQYIRNVVQAVIYRKTGNLIFFLLPLSILLLMVLVSGGNVLWPFIMFSWIQTVASVHFGVIGINAAHHHPEIFHDGDTPRKDMDWGMYQLDCVMDRTEITGSHFLVLTNFGDHALHHLFPTIDHGLLEYLYPVFLKTCANFGIEWRLVSQKDLVVGQFQQLIRDKPKMEAPRSLKGLKVA